MENSGKCDKTRKIRENLENCEKIRENWEK